MSLKLEFGRAIRRQLGHYPVWDLGTPCSVGDYGIVEDRCFKRLGSIRDVGVSFRLNPPSTPAPYAFTSENVSVGETAISATAGAAGPKASLDLHFQTAYSLLVRASDSVVDTMGDVVEVFAELQNHPE